MKKLNLVLLGLILTLAACGGQNKREPLKMSRNRGPGAKLQPGTPGGGQGQQAGKTEPAPKTPVINPTPAIPAKLDEIDGKLDSEFPEDQFSIVDLSQIQGGLFKLTKAVTVIDDPTRRKSASILKLSKEGVLQQNGQDFSNQETILSPPAIQSEIKFNLPLQFSITTGNPATPVLLMESIPFAFVSGGQNSDQTISSGATTTTPQANPVDFLTIIKPANIRSGSNSYRKENFPSTNSTTDIRLFKHTSSNQVVIEITVLSTFDPSGPTPQLVKKALLFYNKAVETPTPLVSK